MNILVTGAAGFFGSNLSEYLLNKNHTVVGVDNFNSFYNPKIKEHNIKDFKAHPNFTLHRFDLLDTQKTTALFETHKFDAVIHLAAWAGVTDSLENPLTYVRNNLEVTTELAELAVKHKVGNFVFASTSSVYGPNLTPFSEDMTTDYPLAPYPATKKACEVMLYGYQKNYGLPVTIFRIFNPIGPRLRPDLALPKLLRSCLYPSHPFPQYWQNAGETARDYTYILHMFEAVDAVLAHPQQYEIFNLGNSTPEKLSTLIDTVGKVVGKSPVIEIKGTRMGEMVDTYANIDKAKKVLGYDPKTTMAECVQIYYDWFMQQDENYQKGVF